MDSNTKTRRATPIIWQSYWDCGACPRLLQRRGLRVRELQAGNYETLDFPGLLIKDSYWRWPTHERTCNPLLYNPRRCLQMPGTDPEASVSEVGTSRWDVRVRRQPDAPRPDV